MSLSYRLLGEKDLTTSDLRLLRVFEISKRHVRRGGLIDGRQELQPLTIRVTRGGCGA